MKHSTKPTIMILGSGHFANPGLDAYNYRMDDVLAPKRQSEIEETCGTSRTVSSHQGST